MSTGYKINGVDFEDIYQKTGIFRNVAFDNSGIVDSIYKNPGSSSHTPLSQFAKKLAYQIFTNDSNGPVYVNTTGYKNEGVELFSNVALKNWSPTWDDGLESNRDVYYSSENVIHFSDAWNVSSFNAEVMRITTPGVYTITNTEIPDKKAVNYVLWGGGGGGGGGAGGASQGSGGGGGGIVFGSVSIPFKVAIGSGGAGGKSRSLSDGDSGIDGSWSWVQKQVSDGWKFVAKAYGGTHGRGGKFFGTPYAPGVGGSFQLTEPEYAFGGIKGQNGTRGGLTASNHYANLTTFNDFCPEKTTSITPYSGIQYVGIYTEVPDPISISTGNGGCSIGPSGSAGEFNKTNGIWGGGGGGGEFGTNSGDGTNGGDGGIIIFY